MIHPPSIGDKEKQPGLKFLSLGFSEKNSLKQGLEWRFCLFVSPIKLKFENMSGKEKITALSLTVVSREGTPSDVLKISKYP